MKKIYTYIISFLLLFTFSCNKDFLETTPSDSINDQLVFKTPQGAEAALNGIYRYMYSYNTDGEAGSHEDFGQKGLDLQNDLMGEDMVMTIMHWFGYNYGYRINALGEDYARPRIRWYFYYKIINNANTILANMDKFKASETFKNSVKGQALALRAYSYFNLIQSFSKTLVGHESALGVPVYTEPSSPGKGRGTVQQVYTQIVSDLDQAVSLLANADPRSSLSMIDLSVAQGIYARVALVMNDWAKARTMAAAARADYGIMSAEEYTAGFNDVQNPEWMWGFDINPEQGTVYASFFYHMAPNISGYAGGLGIFKNISRELYEKMNTNDVRKSLFDNYTAPVTKVKGKQFKFMDNGRADWSDDYVMMRSSEMVLIEAEAAARGGDEATAKQLLDELRANRYAGTFETSPNTGNDLIEEILLERRIELWGEGFALFDIKRNKKGLNRGTSHPRSVANVYVLPPESNSFEFQIPKPELDANPAIPREDQNPNPTPQ